MSGRVDYFGKPLPEGYDRWTCSECTASCTFEAMMQCHGEMPCPYFREGVEANEGAFALIKRREGVSLVTGQDRDVGPTCGV